MKLIDDIKKTWWRLWSLRLQALGLAIQTAFLAWGELPLQIWAMMPHEVKAHLPAKFVFVIPALFFAAAAFARVVKQDKLNDKS